MKYELLEEIGHGGMATVYRARDRRLERDVAVKIIHRHLHQSPEILRRFILEATTIAKLKHRNVVEVYDVSDEDSSERFLVVELVEGCTLRDVLRKGALHPEVAAAIVVEVGAGLAHAHGHGVVHRDVKPENVLLQLPGKSTRSGANDSCVRVKLTDFGIAKLLDAEGLTSTGQLLGSPSHMAPEQVDGSQVDERSDVFSLGVLFYECLVGKLPFAGKHPAQVLRKVLAGEFTPAERAKPQVGIAYSRIVGRALARSPDERYSTVQQMVDAIVRELSVLGLEDTERLLESVASDEPNLEALIVDRLILRGDRARAGGDMPGATEALGRALVYRPADQQLIRRLSGLTRRRALRGAARYSGLGAILLSIGVGAAVLGFGASVPERQDPVGMKALSSVAPPLGLASAQTQVPQLQVTSPLNGPRAVPPELNSPQLVLPGQKAVKTTPQQKPQPSAKARASLRPVFKSAKRPVRRASQVVPRRGTSPGADSTFRSVVVRIAGAMGGTLKIDGEPKQWFGDVQHSLSVGAHRFEFESPDPTCCESTARVVDVRAGEGVQKVLGQIPFIEAVLRIDSSEGGLGRLECPTLFSGIQSFPGERRVPMARLQVTEVCTLRNELPGALPQRRVIRLRAGRTTVIPWP